MVAEIRTKRESLDLAIRGCFGNQFPTWRSLDELKASGWDQPVMLRYSEPLSKFYRPNVPYDQIDAVVADLASLGADKSKISAQISVDGTAKYQRIMNGEIVRTHDTLYELFYAPNCGIMAMRESLIKLGQYAYGLRALALVRYHMDPSSYEDLQAIWDQWPDAVVEFSIFKQNVGDRPHRNTIFWECRTTY